MTMYDAAKLDQISTALYQASQIQRLIWYLEMVGNFESIEQSIVDVEVYQCYKL